MLPAVPPDKGEGMMDNTCRKDTHWVNIVITPEGSTYEDLVELCARALINETITPGGGPVEADKAEGQTSANASSSGPIENCPPSPSSNLNDDSRSEQDEVITSQDHGNYEKLSAEVVNDLVNALSGDDCEVRCEDQSSVAQAVSKLDESDGDARCALEQSASETSFCTAVDTDVDFESAEEFPGNVTFNINEIQLPLFPTSATEFEFEQDTDDDSSLLTPNASCDSSQTQKTVLQIVGPGLEAQCSPELLTKTVDDVPSVSQSQETDVTKFGTIVEPITSSLNSETGASEQSGKYLETIATSEADVSALTESQLAVSDCLVESPEIKDSSSRLLDDSLCRLLAQLNISSLESQAFDAAVQPLSTARDLPRETVVRTRASIDLTVISGLNGNANQNGVRCAESLDDTLKQEPTFDENPCSPVYSRDLDHYSSTPNSDSPAHAEEALQPCWNFDETTPAGSGTVESVEKPKIPELSTTFEEYPRTIDDVDLAVEGTFATALNVSVFDAEESQELVSTQSESCLHESHVAHEGAIQFSAKTEATEISPKLDIILAAEALQSVKEQEFVSCIESGRVTTTMPTAESPQSDSTAVAAATASDDSEATVDGNPFQSRSKLCKTPPPALPSEDVRVDAEARTTSATHVDNRKNCEADVCPNVDEALGRRTVSPTMADTDEGVAQQCLMESSVSEDSGIDVPQALKEVSVTQNVDGCNVANFSEAGPDVANVDRCGSDERFQSASDFFLDPNSLDFLENCDSGKFAQSALSRMSLYMKFDPLVPAGALSPASRRLTMWLKQQQESATKDTRPKLKPADNTFEVDGQEKLIDLECSLNLENRSHGDDTTSPRSNLFAEEKIGSGSGVGLKEVSGVGDDEVRQMLKIQELLFQDRQLMKDREWDERLRSLESEKQRLSEQMQTMRESQHQMRQIVAEYEKTISELISDKETNQRTMTESAVQITRERDQALEDLQNVETAFADLHRRYEKAKLTVEGFKKNEDTLKECMTSFQAKINRQVEKYEQLRSCAEERLDSANIEIENMKKSNEAELAALRAQLKKAEMKVESLEKSLEQKVKENSELTNICDELIARVGHNA